MPNFSLYPAIVDGFTLPNVKMLDPDVGAELMTVMAGGQIDPVKFALAFRDSKTPFETSDFATVFNTIGMNLLFGKACSAGATMQFQLADNGSFATGFNHVAVASPKGYCYVEEINADQDAKEPASMKLQYCFLKSGGVYAAMSNVHALTGSPGLTDFFALGPIYHNGVQVVGIQRARFTTGIRYTTVRSDGETEAAEGKVDDRNLQIECDLNNLAGVTSLEWGVTPSSGTVAMYLRKCISGGGRVSDATNQHIKVALDVSTIELRGVKKGAKTDALATLIFHLHNQGVSMSLASTIP